MWSHHESSREPGLRHQSPKWSDLWEVMTTVYWLMAHLQDEIARTSIELYNTLPKHGKPRLRDNGIPEWTILASISLVRNGQITPISLGAGVKVLPANRLPPRGDTVHDCHAEILARRGFVRWIIEESRRVRSRSQPYLVPSPIERTDEGKLRWKKDVGIWLYVSALPVSASSTSSWKDRK